MKFLLANLNISFLTLLIVIFALGACCTKKDCIYEPHRTVLFKKFPLGSLDSVWVYRLDVINNFTQPFDSLLVKVRKDEDSLYHLTYKELRITELNVYKIKIPKASKEYLITEMRFEKTKDCNNCFPAQPKSHYYEKFVGCKINGIEQKGDLIEISF